MDEDSENLPMPMANVNVKEMFTSLNKPSNKVGKDRLVAYGFLASSLESQKDTTNIIQQYSIQLFKYLSRDVLSQEHDIVAVVTRIILYCVKDKLFLERVTKDEAEDLLVAVLKAAKQKQSEDVTKQLLSILGQQRLPIGIVTSQVAIILDTLEFIHTEGNGKTLYGADIVEVLVSLHATMAQTLTHHAQRCCRMVFPCLGHPLASVRAKSFDLLKHYKSSLSGNLELGKFVLKTIDNDLAKALLSLVIKNPQYVMDVWCFVLDIAGKAMHKGSTINVMLEIIENGFKGSQESRIVSFRAWRKLIDNFALEQDVISDAKRIRLVMMVLKTNNAKVEMVALEKLKTWWHFVRSIGNKLPSVLEQITYPLLQFCVGCVNQSSQNACPSPNFALKMSSPCASKALANIQSRIGSQQLPSFPVLQKIGFEVISHLLSGLGDNSKVEGFKWTLDPLTIEAFASSANFVKHAPFLMTSLETLLKSIGSQDRETLVVHIWTRLSEHLKVALEKGGKAACRDVFSAFLSHFHALVQADCLQPQILVTLFQSTSDFPNKVLSSTLYNTGIGTAVKGCPAQRLCEILFLPAFLKLSNEKEVHQRLFSRLVSAGTSKQQGALSFIQSVADILDSASSNLASADELYRLWSILAHALLDFVTSTNEVNQGDALEYNFGCLYAVLLLPVQHQLASKISQVVCKVMLRTWKELYHSFARLSALVTNAEANTCLEEISAKVIGIWRPEFKDAANLEYLASICSKMLDCVDFSAVSAGRKQSSFTLSPSKWTKRRQRPLGNFHSFVHLLEKMQLESNALLDQLGDKAFSQKQVGSSGCFLSYTNMAVDIYSHLFTHIPGTVVSQVLTILAAPMARLFNSKAHSTGGVKIFVPSVMSKLEKLWFDICNCVTGRFSDQYDSSFLATLSPLLEVTFPHFRRAIKSQTVTFWSTTFGKSVGLTYPSNLKPVLSAVKEKTAIVLPGWITIDDNVIAESPFTEVSQSQGESQVPAPVLPGFPSPKRHQKGSFLHKDHSPARKSPAASKVSPAKVISPKDAKNLFSSRRNISTDLNMMSDKDFVVISSPTRKRRVLTEHQKEVLKEKRIIPVMYSNLDASQDTSLMAQLNAESQQESMSCSDVIVIDSQASQGKEKIIGSGLQKGLPLRDNSSSSSVGFMVPTHIKPPVRRRSSRIQEMSNDDDSESLNNKEAKKSQKPTLIESEMEKEGPHSDDKQLVSAGGNIEDQNKDLVLSSLGTSTEITPENSPSSSSTSDKVEVPAFGMFRTKNSSSNNVQSETVDESSTSSPKLRRISLRKIKSQEGESSLDGSAVLKVGDLEVNKGKSPRRVPLQRIHDLKTSNKNVAAASEPETQKEDAAAVPQEDTSKQDSEVIVKSPKAESNLDKWLAKSNPPKMARRESPRKKRKFSEIEEEKSPVIPITLVEDTQSPGKVRRPHHDSECIAETPVKSDDSPSPAIRSVRKLFADDEPAAPIVNSSVVDTPKTHAVKVALPTNSVGSKNEVSLATPNNNVADSDEMEILSQGFVASVEDSHALAVDVPQGTDSLKDSSKEKNVGTNVQEMSQSENLFASPEETDSMEPLMSMHMPTLASQTKDFGISSAKSESSSSSRTSSSVESDPKDKIMSGTESEFDPSQATLREECNKTASVNRKKIIVRETLASTRVSRSNAKRTDSTDKKSLPKCEDSLVSVTEGNVICNEDQMEIEAGDKKAVEDPLVIDTTNETETGHKLMSKHDSSESKKESDQSSLEIGEVTPHIKPSNENSSSQRCSTTKKKRLMAKQLSQQRQLGSKSPDVSKAETDCDMVESGKLKRKVTRKLVSPTRRKLSPGVSPPTVKSKHVLRIRTKAVKTLSQSPPAKRRRFEKKDANVDLTGDSSADDDQTLSSLVKQTKLSSNSEKEIVLTNKVEEEVAKKSSDEDSEDDQPLASLVSTNAEGKQVDDKIVEVKENNQSGSVSKEQPDCSTVIIVNPSQDAMVEEDAQKCPDVNDKVVLEREAEESIKERDCFVEDMPSTEEEIPLGQVAPPMDIEGSDQSTGSDEVFDNAKIGSKADDTPISDNDMEIEVTEEKSKDWACEEPEKEISAESTEESCGKTLTAVSSVSESGMRNEGDRANLETKGDDLEEQKETEFVLSDWSPSKSPSCSILRKVATPSSCDRGSRKVSFAEPVVSGESPVREKYHSEALPTSPLICHSYNMNFTRPGSSGIKASRASNYRRRLETSMKKQVHSNLRQRCTGSPTSSPSSQNTYKATQESQLDSINPIFPDLVDCKTSLDCILPQLTSSLWYRGLCQLMKGRNLHTIGDLSALTEVQVNQMPIRCPKVDTVRDALTNYQSQHGGVSTPKSQSRSIFGNTTPSLEGLENAFVNQGTGTPVSNGATLSQAVTPSSIADEGIRILPSAEQDLSQLSPIKDPNTNLNSPEVASSATIVPEDSSAQSLLKPSSSATSEMPQSAESSSSNKCTNIVDALSSITNKDSLSELKGLSMTQLFEVHQKLNNLFGVVVEEMKERSFKS